VEFFDNPEKMPVWLTDFKRFEQISGTRGALLGVVSKQYYEVNCRLEI
jgi:hypothetical protein